jgi:carbonic anhydrase/acetyltransferase-like protein (isoleucine patch superfamily)
VWSGSSIWYGVTLRGDVRSVCIGSYTNIQDNSIVTEAHHPLDVDHDGSTIIGHYVTVGHNCVLRGCTIESECLVGIGSVLTEGSYMERNSMLAAHSVLLPNDRIPSGELWAGNPARFVRKLTEEEKENIKYLAKRYFELSRVHNEEFYLPYNFAYIETQTHAAATCGCSSKDKTM